VFAVANQATNCWLKSASEAKVRPGRNVTLNAHKPTVPTGAVTYRFTDAIGPRDTGESRNMMKLLWVGFTILAATGALTTVVFTIISGVEYRMAEDQGLQPGSTPAWIALGTEVGLWIFALALVALAATGVVALILRRRRNAHHPIASSDSSTM